MAFFKKIIFRSHKNHNPHADIVVGHLDNGTFITYYILLDGPEAGTEGMEYYTGENYGGVGRSHSRNYPPDKIPSKYKNAWDELKSLYEKKYKVSEYKMPNLKETYNRLFGELPEEDRAGRSIPKKSEKQVINESQMKSWLHLHKTFKTQYPNRSLVMSEGVVKLDGHIVESADKFLKRNLPDMVQVLKATHQKIKGLGQ